MRKEIEQDIELLKEEIKKDRMYLGPYPLSEVDIPRWNRVYESNKELANSINNKINTYNLIVPLMNKQKFHIEFDKICNDILINGVHSVDKGKVYEQKAQTVSVQESDDIMGVFFKALGDLLTFRDSEKKKVDNN